MSLTQSNFNATNLKPLASKRLMISPTSPRWTPSGLTMMKVRSWLPAILLAIIENRANSEQIMYKCKTRNEYERETQFDYSYVRRVSELVVWLCADDYVR